MMPAGSGSRRGEMLGLERELLAHAEVLARRADHGVAERRQRSVLSQNRLSEEQERAFDHVTGAGGPQGPGRGRGVGQEHGALGDAGGLGGGRVGGQGAALSGIAAENLQVASGIQARTLASYELAWSGVAIPSRRGTFWSSMRPAWSARGSSRGFSRWRRRRMPRWCWSGTPSSCRRSRRGRRFEGSRLQHGVAELTKVRRQREEWQREATAALATARTPRRLRLREEGGDRRGGGAEQARSALLARWARDAKEEPKASQLVLAYTRDDVHELNNAVRALREQTAEARAVPGDRDRARQAGVCVHDRIRFGRNKKTLGVKNGSLGTVERIEDGVLQVKLEGPATRGWRSIPSSTSISITAMRRPCTRRKVRRSIGPMCSRPRIRSTRDVRGALPAPGDSDGVLCAG